MKRLSEEVSSLEATIAVRCWLCEHKLKLILICSFQPGPENNYCTLSVESAVEVSFKFLKVTVIVAITKMKSLYSIIHFVQWLLLFYFHLESITSCKATF